jgi:hypothetical protein
VVRYTYIRAILSIYAVMKWKVHQMDVNKIFLNSLIEEEVYVEHPQGFETHDSQEHVCILKKYFYGLKKSPKEWYDRIDSFLMSLRFTKSKVDSNLYFKVVYGGPMILLLYVDDLFLTRDNNLITESKRKLAVEF